MSLNIQERDLVTGELKRTIVAGNSNIVDTAIRTDSTWSSRKVSDELGELEKNVKFDVDDLNTAYVPNKTITVRTNKNTKNLPPSSLVNFLVTSFAYIEGQYYRITQYCYENSENLSSAMYVRRGASNDGESSITWSAWQQLATTDSTLKTIQLSGTVDCNTLTEPGLYTASAGAVISITNTPADIGSTVQLDGGFSILVTKTNVSGIYYGMQMFIPYGSDSPFIRKSYYLNGQYWTDWQELATMDKVESKYEEATLDTPVDWNTLNTKARYYVSGGATMTNAPMQQPFGELVVETAGDGSVCRVQKFFSFDGRLYMRRWTGSIWNEWYRFDGTAI